MAQPVMDTRFALDVQGLETMKHSASRDAESTLEAAARQFEALFIQMMLQSMRDAIPESGLLDNNETRFYNDLMDRQWSQELSKKGLGLAEQLSAQLRIRDLHTL